MTVTTRRALVVTRPGGLDVLEVHDGEIADPTANQVQVRVAASGVNFIDVYQRQGIYPIPTPFVLGAEGAGEVVAIGAGVSALSLGDVVAWALYGGSHASVVNVDASVAVPVPHGVAPELAAATMLQGITAHYLITSTYPVQPGDSVLVHAAAGGVGQLLVQKARALGARVIGTAGTAAKRDKALALGAETVLRYDEFTSTADLGAAIRAANGGEGVTVAYDGVGQATFDASLAALARRGMLVLYGASSGQVSPFEIQRLNQGGSLFLTRPNLSDYIHTRDELLLRAGAVLDEIAVGTLKVEIGARFALANAAAAYAALESRATTGKVLLIP
jgi:NADPH2:quinone reductase